MAQAPDKVRKPIESAVRGLGFELVGVEYLPQGRRSLLRVYIDTPTGITLEDCESVSRQVSDALGVDDPVHGDYVLEVSSPGLDRPLFTAEHYARFVGHRVRLNLVSALEGRRNVSGVLESLQDDQVTVTVDGETLIISLDNIERARLIPEF